MGGLLFPVFNLSAQKLCFLRSVGASRFWHVAPALHRGELGDCCAALNRTRAHYTLPRCKCDLNGLPRCPQNREYSRSLNRDSRCDPSTTELKSRTLGPVQILVDSLNRFISLGVKRR